MDLAVTQLQTPKSFTFNDLILRVDSPKLPYRRRDNEVKTAIHWGQRKLLISEIEFFTIHWDQKLIPNTHSFFFK